MSGSMVMYGGMALAVLGAALVTLQLLGMRRREKMAREVDMFSNVAAVAVTERESAGRRRSGPSSPSVDAVPADIEETQKLYQEAESTVKLGEQSSVAEESERLSLGE